MPSHPERVRRSYHDIKIIELENIPANKILITIPISRLEIATAMTKKELEYNVIRLIKKGIQEQYK